MRFGRRHSHSGCVLPLKVDTAVTNCNQGTILRRSLIVIRNALVIRDTSVRRLMRHQHQVLLMPSRSERLKEALGKLRFASLAQGMQWYTAQVLG